MDKKIKPKRGDAFDIPESPAFRRGEDVKPRQAAYKAGPGIVVLGSDASRRDAEMRRVMRLTKI